MSVNYGARYCFGIFVKPLSVEHGWSHSVISLAATINMLIYSIGAIFVGRMLDKFAPRWIMTTGAIIAAAGFILTGFVNSPLTLYLAYGLLVGLGATGMGVVICSSSVGKWFIKMRGLAIGIATMGISFGIMTLTPLAGFLGRYFSWRAGMFILGAITLTVGVTVSQLLMRKTHPEAYGLLPDGDKIPLPGQISAAPAVSKISLRIIFKDSRFWTIAISQSLIVMVIMSVFVHQVAYAVDNEINSIAAASSLAAISVTGFIGQFFFGWLSDRLRDAKYAYFLGISFLLCGMILLNYADNVRSLYLYAVIYGFGYGCIAPILPILIVDRFGRHTLGSIYGLLTFFIGFIGSLGPILGGIIYDYFGSYHYLWLINTIILALTSIIILTLKKYNP
ncbi:MAG: MFS transporter [Smithellaceae bacterium]|nr:MFS transporter [Syntrophaceae bacterium]MBP8609193.1 MFS transporter [Syntrophaceae bacterium]NMD04802.1 MFS transporter [Deltaproteobacteria bacterium]